MTAGPLQPPESLPPESLPAAPLEPLHVDTARVVLVGTVLWLAALVLTLAVPGLHRGAHSWWPWAAVAGTLLGGVGLAYLRRGRGNAAAQ